MQRLQNQSEHIFKLIEENRGVEFSSQSAYIDLQRCKPEEIIWTLRKLVKNVHNCIGTKLEKTSVHRNEEFGKFLEKFKDSAKFFNKLQNHGIWQLQCRKETMVKLDQNVTLCLLISVNYQQRAIIDIKWLERSRQKIDFEWCFDHLVKSIHSNPHARQHFHSNQFPHCGHCNDSITIIKFFLLCQATRRNFNNDQHCHFPFICSLPFLFDFFENSNLKKLENFKFQLTQLVESPSLMDRQHILLKFKHLKHFTPQNIFSFFYFENILQQSMLLFVDVQRLWRSTRLAQCLDLFQRITEPLPVCCDQAEF